MRFASLCSLALLAACRPSSPQPVPTVAPTGSSASESAQAGAQEDGGEPRDISGQLEAIRAETGVPGLAAAVVDDQGLVAVGAAGRKRVDEAAPLTGTDVFHLGSDSKAMTAFLVGRLVDRGVVDWDLTLAEMFREHADSMNGAYRSVTLEQLLRHRGGIESNLSPEILGAVRSDVPERAFRPELARVVLQREPANEPGEAFLYSNLGYIVIGAALEVVTDKTWETLMRTEVFDPLGMTSCGFGPTSTGEDRGSTWAHAAGDDGTYLPVAIDNPPVLGPAGTVHCSLPDWGKFAAAQFDQSEHALVSTQTLARLHEPTPAPERGGRGYALGWLVTDIEDGEVMVLTHDGSNTVNYASIAVVPERKVAVMAASNAGDQRAQKAVVQAVVGLLDAYGKQPNHKKGPEPGSADPSAR